MALEPKAGRATPLGDNKYVIKWTLEELLSGLTIAVHDNTQVQLECTIVGEELHVVITLPSSFVDSQVDHDIGAVETEVGRRFGLHPETDKSID